MKIRVLDVAHQATTDIDETMGFDANELDKLVKKCLLQVAQALSSPVSTISEFQRHHLSVIFESMGHTHETIREILRHGWNSPVSADALPVARLQLEMLYSLCLMIEDPRSIDWYLKHSWRQTFVRYLLEEQERRNLPRFKNWLQLGAQDLLFKLRGIVGVTDAEVATIRQEELGEPMPPGLTPTPIRQFPTPKVAMRHIQVASRRKMLMRLYPEYQVLSSYVHSSSTQLRVSKTLLNPRSRYRSLFTSGEMESLFQRVGEEAIWISYLSIVQCATELAEIYPANLDLHAGLAAAWSPLVEGSLLGRAIWEIRSRAILGVLAP